MCSVYAYVGNSNFYMYNLGIDPKWTEIITQVSTEYLLSWIMNIDNL